MQTLLLGIPTDAFPVIALCVLVTCVAVFVVAPRYASWVAEVVKSRKAAD